RISSPLRGCRMEGQPLRYAVPPGKESGGGTPNAQALHRTQERRSGLSYFTNSRILANKSAAFFSASSTGRPFATPGRLWPAVATQASRSTLILWLVSVSKSGG